MQNLQKREFGRNMSVDEKELIEYEAYNNMFLQSLEQLENIGYGVTKEITPDLEHYWIRKDFTYLEIKIYKQEKKKGTVEFSYDGKDFSNAGIGLDIFVDNEDIPILVLYFLQNGKCDESYTKLS